MLSLVKLIALPAIALAVLIPSAGALGADCVLNGNPTCSAAVNLGTIAGDSGSAVISRSGVGEAFFYVRIQENSSGNPRALNASVQLQVPAGMDYDLIVRCASCTSTAAQMSKQGVGASELVNVTRADTFADNSYTIFIEVRYFNGTGCGSWTLTIGGNTAAAQTPLACA